MINGNALASIAAIAALSMSPYRTFGRTRRRAGGDLLHRSREPELLEAKQRHPNPFAGYEPKRRKRTGRRL